MQTTSEEFDELVANGDAVYTITLTKSDNTKVNMQIDNFEYIGTKCIDDNITFGNAPCQCVKFSIHNPSENLENEELFIQQGLYIDGTLENVDIGYFTVQKPVSDGEVTQYTAFDRMTKFERIYTPSSSVRPFEVSAILSDISTQTGITIQSPIESSFIDYVLEESVTLWGSQYTMREILGYLGGLYGKDAMVDRNGEVIFRWYNTVDYTIDGHRIYQGSTNIETDMVIGKIVCTKSLVGASTSTLTVGSGDHAIYVSNPFMHDYMLAQVYNSIGGFQFRALSTEFLGDFRLDLGDVINVVKNAVTYPTCIMQIKHQSDGGVRTSIASQSKTESEQDIDVAGSNTRNIDRITEYIKPYGLTINSSSLNLVEGSQNRTVPLATSQQIDDIGFSSGLINSPNIYSLNERKIGVWIDSKSLYQKTIYISQLPNSSVLEIDPNVNNLYEIIYFNGYCAPINKSDYPLSITRPLPNADSGTNAIRTDSQNGNVRVITYSDWSTYRGWLTIRYTKTTD